MEFLRSSIRSASLKKKTFTPSEVSHAVPSKTRDQLVVQDQGMTPAKADDNNTSLQSLNDSRGTQLDQSYQSNYKPFSRIYPSQTQANPFRVDSEKEILRLQHKMARLQAKIAKMQRKVVELQNLENAN